MTTYPVAEKFGAAAAHMQTIRDFLEFAGEKHTQLLYFAGDGIGYVGVNLEDLLYEFYDIDAKALERERRAMLDQARG